MKIIFFSEIKWQYLRTRKQQIIRCFPKDWEILFIEPYRLGVENSFKLRSDGNVRYATFPFFKNFLSPVIKKLLAFVLVRKICGIVMGLWGYLLLYLSGFAKFDVVLVSNIYAAPFIGFLAKGKPIIYDCNDDHLGFPHTPAWAKDYFERICRLAHKIIIVAPSMLDLIPVDCKNKTVVIGNGVDSRLFDWRRPIMVYAGAISQCLDLDLLVELANRSPDRILLIVGADILVPACLSKLGAMPNVRILPSVRHDILSLILSSCDVGLIPFVRNRLTAHLNPNKLFEYFAAGLPVVSMNLSPELCSYSDKIFLADNKEDFIRNVDSALSKPKTGKESSRAVAWQNDWNKKADLVQNLLVESDVLFKMSKKGVKL